MEHLEGKCTNCGSIIRIQKDAPTHCIFCWSVNDANSSIEALKEENTVFPNLVIDEPDELTKQEAISQYQGKIHSTHNFKRKTDSNKPAIKKTKITNKEAKLSPVEKVALMNEEVFNPKANKKIIWLTTISFALIVGIFLSLAFPLTYKKNNRRLELIKEFSKISEAKKDLLNLENSSHFHFESSFSDLHFSLVAKKEINLDDAKFIFKSYEKALQSVNTTFSNTSFIKDLNVKIIHKHISYIIKYDDNGNMQISELKK